jgi:hypothetical protein
MNGQNADFKGSSILRTMWGVVGNCDAHEDMPARSGVMGPLEALQTRRDSRIEDYDGHLPAMISARPSFRSLYCCHVFVPARR